MYFILLGDPRHAESVNKARRMGPTADNPTHLVRVRYDDEKVISSEFSFQILIVNLGVKLLIRAFRDILTELYFIFNRR